MLRFAAGLIVAFALTATATASAASPLALDDLGRAQLGGAEIAAFDPKSDRAFVTDAIANALHIVDLADPAAPQKVATIDLSPYGAGPNSVAVSPINGGLVAVAVEAAPKTAPGAVVLFDHDGKLRAKPIATGALPDMVTFTPNGRTLLVANEGEPNDLYTTDPEGSVTVIDFERGLGNPRVRTAGFTGVPLEGPVRLFGFNSPTVAQDLEPEYIATDGSRAWVTLQENNAIGLLDVGSATLQQGQGARVQGPRPRRQRHGRQRPRQRPGLDAARHARPARGPDLRAAGRPGDVPARRDRGIPRRAGRRCSSAPTKATRASTRWPTSRRSRRGFGVQRGDPRGRPRRCRLHDRRAAAWARPPTPSSGA